MYYASDGENYLSGFEMAIFAIAGFVAFSCWLSWYRDLLLVNHWRSPIFPRAGLAILPLFCLASIFFILSRYGAPAVRSDPTYLACYTVLGAGWLGAATRLFPFLGLSVRDDVLERRNNGACVAIAGAVAGICCCFCGANIGDGPGAQVVLFSAALASLFFFVFWVIRESLSHVSEAITIDRDLGAGIRLGGFLLSVGMICGWSVAGDWKSVLGTIRDFEHSAGPVALLCVLPPVLQRFRGKNAMTPLFSRATSLIIGLGYLVCALAWILLASSDS
jgi:uncharacterized membrane protein YjfL (UPF0719 family)